ncbi:hypothetical protein DIPPA_07914 [Diplonema papillatum]|nr:hypothetical protein DIPPA_07914 [Diplonema papillatum]
MAAVFMNPLIFVVLALLVNGMALVWRTVKKVPWLEALGHVQSPGVLFVPYLFLLQGTSLVAARLLFFPKSTGPIMLAGAVVLAACVASPILVYQFVVRVIPATVKYVPDPKVAGSSTDFAYWIQAGFAENGGVRAFSGWKRTAYLFVFGDSVAVTVGESWFAERWSHVCDPYRPNCAVFACLEAGQMIVISLLSGWRPSVGAKCNARNFILCAMLLLYAAALVIIRPFNAALDNLLASAVAVVMFFSMLFMALGIAVEAPAEGVLFTAATDMLLATAAIAITKAVWDVGLYLFDLYIERRSAVREGDRQGSGSRGSGTVQKFEADAGDDALSAADVFSERAADGHPLLGGGNMMSPLLSSASLLSPLGPMPGGGIFRTVSARAPGTPVLTSLCRLHSSMSDTGWTSDMLSPTTPRTDSYRPTRTKSHVYVPSPEIDQGSRSNRTLSSRSELHMSKSLRA